MQIMDPTQESYSNSKKQQNSGYTVSDVCDVKWFTQEKNVT